MPFVNVNGIRLNVLQLDCTGQGTGAASVPVPVIADLAPRASSHRAAEPSALARRPAVPKAGQATRGAASAASVGAPVEDLVMVHGMATNMAFWYFAYGLALSKRFRVTLYDLRGHGRSDMPAAGYTPSDHARDLRGVLDALGIERAHLMAHSFGGVVALNFACEQPDRVQSLVLADSHFSVGRKVQASDAWAFGHKLRPILERHGIDLDVADPYFGPRLLIRCAEWSVEGRPIPGELAHLVSPLLGKTGKRTSSEWLKLMTTTRAQEEMTRDDGLTLERLRKLRMPIIAMYGDDSPARLSGTELLQIWPHAVFRRVRDAGHFFPTLRPAEVLATCKRFWDGKLTPASMRPRADEQKRSWFRSDRIYGNEGAWYFAARGQPRIGPFASREEAKHQLAAYFSVTTASTAVT